jgi:hypothetical protein
MLEMAQPQRESRSATECRTHRIRDFPADRDGPASGPVPPATPPLSHSLPAGDLRRAAGRVRALRGALKGLWPCFEASRDDTPQDVRSN